MEVARRTSDARTEAFGTRAAEALIRAYLVELGESLDFQRIDEELASLPGVYSPPQGLLLVAWRGLDPVGVGAFRPLPANLRRPREECEMKRLYVILSERKSGVGAALATRLINEAKEAGYRRMVLDTLERLSAANALYHSLGFTEITSYNGNPLPDAKFFALELGEPAI